MGNDADYVARGEGRITRYEYGNGPGRVTASLDGGVWTLSWVGVDGSKDPCTVRMASQPDRGEAARKAAIEMTRLVDNVLRAQDELRRANGALLRWAGEASKP